tara:strand:+ start:64 stop:1260 length:1197 start_codon:yes stop_codon:yes gene_type:complete
MANIPIWPGSSSFGLINKPTPFGFYDDDQDFQNDADRVSVWCAQRLGYPLVDVELQQINFYSCFEEAVNEYGAQVYNFQIIDNLGKIVGTPTGSTLNQINVSVDLSTNFGSNDTNNVGDYTSDQRVYSASLSVKRGTQKYDLLTTGSVSWETGSADISTGSLGIRVKKIYHYAPAAINRYFDPYAGTGTGIQSLMQTFGFGNYSPGVNFMLMPTYFDALKIQAIELNDQIRKSAYHFEINSDRFLKLFPVPTSDYKLWFDYVVDVSSVGADYNPATGEAASTSLVTDISNAPYSSPTYQYINEPGRQWIRKYTLALAKEMLGSVRGKYQTIPIPGSDTTLDYTRLLSEATSEKEYLIATLREDLAGVTTQAQLDRTTSENESRKSGLEAQGRYQIYIH